MPTTVFIAIDGQNDLCEWGTQPVTGGNVALSLLGQYLSNHATEYTRIITTQNWYKPESTYCAAGTRGSQLHPALAEALPPDTVRIVKEQETPHGSAFNGTIANRERPTTPEEYLRTLTLRHGEPLTIDGGGLTLDYSVGSTLLDARKHFPNAIINLILPFTARISHDTSEATLSKLQAANINIFRRLPITPSARAGELLGPKLSSFIAPGGQHTLTEKQAETVLNVWNMLTPVETSPVIRAWFMGDTGIGTPNGSPAEALAAGETDVVMAEARAFKTGA